MSINLLVPDPTQRVSINATQFTDNGA